MTWDVSDSRVAWRPTTQHDIGVRAHVTYIHNTPAHAHQHVLTHCTLNLAHHVLAVAILVFVHLKFLIHCMHFLGSTLYTTVHSCISSSQDKCKETKSCIGDVQGMCRNGTWESNNGSVKNSAKRDMPAYKQSGSNNTNSLGQTYPGQTYPQQC